MLLQAFKILLKALSLRAILASLFQVQIKNPRYGDEDKTRNKMNPRGDRVDEDLIRIESIS
ncbi:hypothetical protein D3C78_1324460 [compost metagenome]